VVVLVDVVGVDVVVVLVVVVDAVGDVVVVAFGGRPGAPPGFAWADDIGSTIVATATTAIAAPAHPARLCFTWLDLPPRHGPRTLPYPSANRTA
jgi:hypothetical protein